MREDCLDALAELATCALESAHERPRARTPSTRTSRSTPRSTRRLHAVTASLTIEGTGDLPALMLAVRALRALAG